MIADASPAASEQNIIYTSIQVAFESLLRTNNFNNNTKKQQQVVQITHTWAIKTANHELRFVVVVVVRVLKFSSV